MAKTIPRTILCAIDESELAPRLAAAAADLAKALEARLLLAHVEVQNSRLHRDMLHDHVWDIAVLPAEALGRHRIVAAALAAAQGKAPTEAILAKGLDAAEAIVALAHRYDADHLVIGTRTTTALARLFIGSVAMAVVAHAPCPVTVMK